jgi:hypothetical protein
VHDLIRETCPDIICFSESKKEDFSSLQLQQIDPGGKFSWNWLPAVKIAGGILVGINNEFFDIVKWDILSFFVSVQIKVKRDKIVLRVIAVYGSAYDEHKLRLY